MLSMIIGYHRLQIVLKLWCASPQTANSMSSSSPLSGSAALYSQTNDENGLLQKLMKVAFAD